MALMVRSRRARSSVRLSIRRTWSGRRPSEYPFSARKVVTSTGSSPKRTVTVPYCNPVGTTFGNRAVTCAGVAEVVTS